MNAINQHHSKNNSNPYQHGHHKFEMSSVLDSELLASHVN